MPELPPLYLIAGGPGSVRARGPDPLLLAAMKLSPASRPSVAYIGAASGDNPAFRVMIAGLLRRAGAGSVVLAPLCGRKADPRVARDVVARADIVFVSGGDVEEGMRVLHSHRMLPFLRSMRRAGKPFFGVSAGSIMLARSWIRWKDPKDEASAELFPCMGFAPVICDTHGEADDWVELRAALSLRRAGAVGYGIVSGSALVVEPDGSLTARCDEVHVFRRRKNSVVQVESLRP